ncbi:MAG TPA: hypothetical protein DCM62_04130 [Bacteroidales bacterium]|nr:hypothetical protein [Bacteroidales bacterium]
MKNSVSVLFLALLIPVILKGQTTLEGRVSGPSGNALANIHILIHLPGSMSVAGFAITDRAGYWHTSINAPTDSIDVATSSVQYRDERKRLANRSQIVHFELVPEIRQLREFTVRAPSIVQLGDTISYLVSAFVRGQDRTIADVLNRMPGIEVEPSGRILYKGRPIQHFYVEGLDLMGGRYAMVSQNLPHRSVATVEILENHQPKRILEKRVPSFETSLNLRLKRDITTTGSARLASAPNPLLWYANITPMTFIERFQMLTSYQANNTGRDLAGQINRLTLEDFGRQSQRPSGNQGFLSIQPIVPGNIPGRRFRLNNVHLLNTNALFRLNNDMQFRANVHYLNDNQQQKGVRMSSIFTPTDTISFSEMQENQLFMGHLQGEFTLKRNVKQQFLENNLQFNAVNRNQRGLLTADHTHFNQALQRPMRNLSNDLRIIHPIQNLLVEFFSYIFWDTSPHKLTIGPGRFEQALGLRPPIAILEQNVVQDRFFADHSAGLSFSWLGLSIGPRIGFTHKSQNLVTNLQAMQGNDWNQIGSAFQNSTESRHSQAYLNTEVIHQRGQLTLTARLPFALHDIKISDPYLQESQQMNRFVFNPSLRANYRASAAIDFGGSVSHSTNFGEIDNVYYGFILLNNRRLQRSATSLSVTTSNSFSANIRYRNPFASIFGMANYLFSVSNHSLIFSQLIQPDGSTLLQTIEKPNQSVMHTLNTNIAFPIRIIRTNVNLTTTIGINQREVLVNNQLFESLNRFLIFNPKLNKSIGEGISLEYSINIAATGISMEKQPARVVSVFSHQASLGILPATGHTILLSGEEFRIRGANTLFVDVEYRFTLPNRQIDFSLNMANLLNNRNLSAVGISDFSIIETTYPLRGRTLTFSARVSF